MHSFNLLSHQYGEETTMIGVLMLLLFLPLFLFLELLMAIMVVVVLSFQHNATNQIASMAVMPTPTTEIITMVVMMVVRNML